MESPSRRLMVSPLSVLLCGEWTAVDAQSNFFEGKNIRIIVGLAAGGGYDVYARMIARHMGKHVRGNPAISVENMTGAGSLAPANYLYKGPRPDGPGLVHLRGRVRLH